MDYGELSWSVPEDAVLRLCQRLRFERRRNNGIAG